jgi:hypothetical protein
LKKAYLLFLTTITLLTISFILIQLLQNKSLSQEIDLLKYYHLQTTIHLDRIKLYYQENNTLENYNLNDNRFDLNVTLENNITYVYLKVKDKPVSNYLKLE